MSVARLLRGRLDWKLDQVPHYRVRALLALLPFVIATAMAVAQHVSRFDAAIDDVRQVTLAVHELGATAVVTRQNDPPDSSERLRLQRLVATIERELIRVDGNERARDGDAAGAPEAVVAVARKDIWPQVVQIISFQAVLVLWIPMLLAITIWRAGRRIVARQRDLEQGDSTRAVIERPLLHRDFAIVQDAKPLQMFVPRLIFGLLLVLGTSYILCPLGLKASHLMSFVESRALPGHTSTPLWSTTFVHAPVMVVGFVGYLLYALLAASRRFFTDDLSDRFVFQLLGRGLVVVLLSFVLSSTPLDDTGISRILIFIAGVFPLSILEQLAERAKVKMDPSLAHAATGFDGLGTLSPLKLEALRENGIESTADLANEQISTVASLVRMSPGLIANAVDRAILIDEVGSKEIVDKLGTFGVTSATELLDISDDEVRVRIAAEIGDAPAVITRRLVDDPRIAQLRNWNAAWSQALLAAVPNEEQKMTAPSSEPSTSASTDVEALDEERVYRKPVAWLMGPQLIASLKGIIVREVLYKGFDIRDWMSPEQKPLDMTELCNAKKATDAGDPFWFDFVADTGDGQLQTYAVAYMCMADLAIPTPQIGAPVEILKAGVQPSSGRKLPRGSFLFIGGDTAYHVADHSTLETRFTKPFSWARQDLKTNGCLTEGEPRPLVGIPGNHDYYDLLNGFNRQFRKPATERFTKHSTQKEGDLGIPGFKRVQEASYFAAHLPYGWWLFGIDTEQDRVDFRQRVFFEAVQNEHKPKKLIIATPSPTTVFQAQPKATDKISVSFKQLKLKRPFLKSPDPDTDVLTKGECRLDLSGDVHHYARYWGPKTGGNERANPHYASVVSGLGGAFHHPSTTKHGDLRPQRLYPDEDTSRKAVASIFKVLTVMSGGYARGIGAFIAALITAAFLIRGPARVVVDRLLGLVPGLYVPQLNLDGRPIGASFCLLGALVVAGGCLFGVVKLAGKIYKRNRDSGGTLQYTPCFLLAYFSVAVVAGTIWWIGDRRLGAVLFDVTLYILLLAIVLGLLALAVFVGAGERGWRVRLGFFGIGLWHLLLQLIPVALLIRVGSAYAFVATVALWFVFCFLGKKTLVHVRQGWNWLLLALWIVFGLTLLLTPFVLPDPVLEEPTGSDIVVFVFFAIALGVVNSCIQLSWYLAVSLGFNGHNNEVGGATRIGHYKQFVRVCVEADKITGYVIAVDEPRKNGANMKLELVDYFELTPVPEQPTATPQPRETAQARE